MDQEKIFEFILEIKSKLSSIDAKVDGILEQIKNHENRIQNIENAMKMVIKPQQTIWEKRQ